MMMGVRLGVALALSATAAIAGDAAPQSSPASADALRQQVERRFDVLRLHNGIALRPKRTLRGVGLIELTEATIAIDGTPVTGAELRDKLGADSEAVLRLSYLDPDARKALFAGAAVQAEKPAEPPSPPPPPTPRRTRHSDTRLRIGGSVTVAEDESVEDVVVIGGSARIDGQVLGDVVVIGGIATFGPHAEVRKDVTVVGGTLRRDAGARIGGSVNEVGPGISFRGLQWRQWPFAPEMFWWGMWGGLFSLVSTLTRVAILSLLASIVLLIGRGYVERIGVRAAQEPLKAGAVGLLAQLLFLPVLIVTIVMLVITIIGIPLLVLVPFAMLALACLFLIGFTAVTYYLGRLVSDRLGWRPLNPYMTAIVGIVVVMLPVLVGRILGLAGVVLLPIAFPVLLLGFLAEYAAWTVGFGAIALNRFDRRAS